MLAQRFLIGRFEEEFVETRRALLERMLQRIVRHPVLQLDADVQAFLESDQLQTVVDERRDAIMSAYHSRLHRFYRLMSASAW